MEAMERLAPFVGEWTIEGSFRNLGPTGVTGRVVFEWMLDRQFLMQRGEVPHPDAPDNVAVMGFDPGTGAYTHHYFDSRGIARLYSMTFDDGVWKLLRDSPDFSPLNFSQRFTGTFSDDGNTIEGPWEIAHDHATWELDFDLIYTRAG
jgi:hypothetical protein